MWERLRRFSALSGAARGVLVRALVMLPLVSRSLKRRGLKATQASLQRRVSSRPKQITSMEKAALTARMVHAAVRHGLGHPTCLEESLVLWWLLARQGIAADVRIGARKHGEKFEAHAWVECAGVAINEPEARHEHYAAFDAAFSSLPPGEE